MPIRRLATSESIIDALVPLMSMEPILTYEDAAAALRDKGLVFGDEEGSAEDAIDDALDYDVGSGALFIVEDRLVHPEALAESKVHTHRITDEDVSGEVIDLFPDCAPWLPALTAGVADPAGVANSAEVDEVEDGTVRYLALAVGDSDPLRAELIGLGTLDDTGTLLILPEDTLAAADLAAGDLITMRLIDRVIRPDALREDPGLGDSVVTQLRAAKDESTLIESLAEFLFRCIIADRTLFDAPTAPLTQLLAVADIRLEGDLLGEISDETASKLRGFSTEQKAAKYDIKTHEAHLLLDFLDSLDEDDAAKSGLTERAYAACADPWFALVLAEEAIHVRERADDIGAFAATPPAGASRAVRARLLYIHGRVRESAADPVAATAANRKSTELHDSSYALRRLATMEFFRGNYDTAHTLLDQSGVGRDFPLHDLIDRATRHTLPAEPTGKLGRNERCWCGSGRKFKVCHGRAGAAAPLSHRAPGLNDRAVGYVLDDATEEVMMLLTWSHAVAGGPVPENELLPTIIDLMLIEDRLMAAFAHQYGAILPDDEVMVLEQWQLEANRSVFDVEASVPGESLTLRDLRTGDRYQVTERSGSQQVQVGEYICTRVADVAGELQLFGGIEPVPLHLREALVELLDSSPTARDMLTRLAARFAPPTVLSPEDDPLVICEARYDVADPAQLRVILDGLFTPSEVDSGEEWAWSEEIDPDQERQLASLELTGDELLITTTTEPRHELIDGQFVMSPAPGSNHQIVSATLVTMLRTRLQGSRLRVLHTPYDVVLGSHVVQPDVVVAPKTGFTTKHLPAPPLLVIEILSPSTSHLDRGRKREIYAEAGVLHYWIVDPEVSSISTFDLADGIYSQTDHASGDQTLTVEHPVPLRLTPAELLDD